MWKRADLSSGSPSNHLKFPHKSTGLANFGFDQVFLIPSSGAGRKDDVPLNSGVLLFINQSPIWA